MSHRSLAALPRLTTVFMGFMILCLGIAAIILIVVQRHHLQDMEDEIQANGALRSARSLQVNFEEAMAREWNSVQAVSSTIDVDNPRSLTPRMKALTRIGDHIVWAGVVDASGRVVASSLETTTGLELEDATFFTRGLRGGFVGSPKDDRLLKLMTHMFPQERRYIDMSAPVVGEDGLVKGVLVYRLGMGWIERVLRASSDALDLDIFLVSKQDGLLVQAGTGGELVARERSLLRAAREVPSRIDLDDGSVSFISVLPPIVQGPFSSLDWKIAIRAKGLPQGILSFDADMAGVIAALVAGLSLMSLVFARMFLAPIERLTDSATDIAEQVNVYPPEERGSRTSYQLSSAMALIQGRLRSGSIQHVGSEVLPEPQPPLTIEASAA